MQGKVGRKTYSSLIGKDDIGRVKPAKYELPGADFTYGKVSGNDIAGVRELTSSWVTHTPSRANPNKQNFKSLNKMSVNIGLATAKDFRSLARVSENVKLVPNVGTRAVKLLLPEDEFTYGNPNRPPTPMNAVMCHDYGNNAAAQTENIYRERIVEAMQQSRQRPKSTKTVQLSMQQNTKRIENLKNAQSHKEENLFKLKKFQTSKPKIDTINKNYVPANRQRPQTAFTRSSVRDQNN